MSARGWHSRPQRRATAAQTWMLWHFRVLLPQVLRMRLAKLVCRAHVPGQDATDSEMGMPFFLASTACSMEFSLASIGEIDSAVDLDVERSKNDVKKGTGSLLHKWLRLPLPKLGKISCIISAMKQALDCCLICSPLLCTHATVLARNLDRNSSPRCPEGHTLQTVPQ